LDVPYLYHRAHTQEEVQVTLNLDAGEDAFNTRVLTFPTNGGSLQVGRASKTEKKQLIPAVDNMWLSNPVISRSHAQLSVEDDKVVKVCPSNGDPTLCSNAQQLPNLYIEDTESSHGTFVNNRNIKAKGKTQLKTGDAVQFGDYVLRGAGMLWHIHNLAGKTNFHPDRFEPPTFTVQIKNVFPDTAPARPSTGRSYSVPDETDEEESEMDESHSEAGSEDSHSSPPHWGEEKPTDASTAPGSSMNNPFTIDDDFVESQKIIIEDVASREASEEYEPEEDVVRDTWFEEVEVEVESEDEDEASEANEDATASYAQQLGGFEFMPSSPIYRPASPSHHIEAPAYEFPTGPVLPLISHDQDTNLYSQGPFAQPHMYNSNIVVGTFPAYYADRRTSERANDEAQYENDHTDEVKAAASAWGASNVSLNTMPQSPGLKHTLHTTATTQDFLDNENFAERTRANKKNMSIKSLINPPAVAGAKRKADDISDDDEEDAVLSEVEVEAEGEGEDEVPLLDITMIKEMSDDAEEVATPSKESKDIIIKAIKVEEAIVPTPTPAVKVVKVVEERPAKRIRTFASHLGSFALGGVTAFAGLACLPENYFR
jgi:pSer/pThr/pTyr-binding forkhead associated (FHA) protein